MSSLSAMDTTKRRLPATAETYQLLREQIITLKLPPGQLLMVQQLSRQLDVSRTPVREAIVRLVEDGLVTPAPGHKFQVAPITTQSLVEIYQTRGALEPAAAAHVALHHTPAQLGQLRGLLDEMNHLLLLGEKGRFFQLDHQFHQLIMVFYGNQLMVELLQRIKARQQRIRFFSAICLSRLADSALEHGQIVDRMDAGDGPGAAQAVQSHLDNVRVELSQLLDAEHPLFS